MTPAALPPAARRRHLLRALAASPLLLAGAAARAGGVTRGLAAPAGSAGSAAPIGSTAGPDMPLDAEQSRRFRAWVTLLIHAQIERGPTPRWVHRDCAGLVRFAVGEALRPHDLGWRQANGLLGQALPADIEPAAARAWQQRWRRLDGSRHAYVGALELVQANTLPVSRSLAQAQGGDLLVYDFGDDQHLMVWMGRYAAYHTGHADARDNGLRAWRAQDLAQWPDTRWRPEPVNPNFLGVYRFAFLTR
jgi:uncharacterized protein YfaT (DUF1175 family)